MSVTLCTFTAQNIPSFANDELGGQNRDRKEGMNIVSALYSVEQLSATSITMKSIAKQDQLLV